MKNYFLYIAVLSLLFAGCKEEYDFPLRSSDVSLMVVEGNLNVGNDSTNITLSRSMKLDEIVQFKPILQAQVLVEGKDNSVSTLTEKGGGNYYSSGLGMAVGNEYRLRIKTPDGKEYLSDWVLARSTPEIDTIKWERLPNGISFSSSTQDPTNNTRYYKWEYEETWQINSYFTSDFKWVGDANIVYTPAQDLPNTCWKYDRSRTIMIGSSAQYAQDVISDLPLYFIAENNEKLGVRYSVLLKQYALSKQAYEYLNLMKKNTETLGSIFDPLPSEMRGNISNVNDPSEIVIGYVNASAETRKRIFVTSIEANWGYPYPIPCNYFLIANHPDSIRKYIPLYLPWAAEEPVPGVITDYYVAPPVCVDCTLRGGNTARPNYW